MRYHLRPATPADYNFIYELKRVTLKPYVVATWGWDEAVQRQRFSQNFDPANHQIVVVDGEDIGDLSVRYGPSAIDLDGIYIQPAFQRQGYGSAIIKNLISQGKQSGRPLRLQVIKGNPAIELYQRLGFDIVEETQTHYRLQVIPEQQ